MRNSKREHIFIVIPILIVITILGILTKFYRGPCENWAHNSFGGVFYEIFWCLIIYLFYSNLNPAIICLIVFITTCILEFIQLVKYPVLEIIRKNFIGRSLIGNSFNWFDFPYYIAGILLSYLLLKILRNTIKTKLNKRIAN